MHIQRSSILKATFLFILFFGTGLHHHIQAQDTDELNSMKIVGNANLSPGDIIADRDDNRDINGQLTAGLRVKTDLTGLQFRSNNGIHKAQQLPGATLLYLSTNERIVTVYKDGYPPFQIILSEEGINLEAGKVWELQVTGNKRASNAPVRFSITPENATIILDGKEFPVDGTVFEQELAEGMHFVQIRKSQHEFVDDSINVSTATVNSFAYNLEPIDPIPVLINSEPRGASIYLNNEPGSKGVTPQRIFVYPGELTVRLTLPGYSDVQDKFEFTGDINEYSYNLQEYIGYLTVNTDPGNAAVLIDEELQNSRENIRLVPGPHILEVRSSGYDPVRKTVNIAQGDSLVEDINLDQITGNLYVVAQQPQANMSLRRNGQVIESWVGAKTLRNLPVGDYQIVASLTNFTTKTVDVTLRRNDDRNVNVDLTQIDGQGTLSINGVFKDAEVTVKGRSYSRSFNKLPIQIPALPHDTYEITIKKDGFSTVKKDVKFESLSDDITFVDEFKPKTKGKAFFRSLFFPGSGHGYLDKGGRGFLYFLGSAAAIGYTVKSFLDYQTSYADYQAALTEYNSAPPGSNFSSLKEDYLSFHETAVYSREQIEIGLMALGAVKALETLDLLFTRSNKKKLRKAKVEFNAQNSGIGMQVNF